MNYIISLLVYCRYNISLLLRNNLFSYLKHLIAVPFLGFQYVEKQNSPSDKRTVQGWVDFRGAFICELQVPLDINQG